jgi:Trk K+ transport system NAD-binding subunit
MAHIAAPHFVAAALLDEHDEHLGSMRLGDGYVAVCRLTVNAAPSRGSRRRRLERRSAKTVLARTGCQILATQRDGGPWASVTEDPGRQLRAGDEVLIGGPLDKVFAVVRDASVRLESGLAVDGARPDPGAPRPRLRRARQAPRRLRMRARALWSRVAGNWFVTSSTATRVVFALLAVVTLAVAVFPRDGLADGFHLWVSTALGNEASDAEGDSLRSIANAVGLLCGGIAVGLWVSLMAAHLMDNRLIETAFRRARRLRGHVVVVGLGEVGLRVSEMLARLEIPYAVVNVSDSSAAEDARRALQHMVDAPPILAGDLDAAMGHAGVDRAAAVIACAPDNLINIQACLRAKRAVRTGEVRTVARIFDDQLAADGADMLGVDRQLAAVELAAPAFVETARTGERVRDLERHGGPAMTAVAWPADKAVAPETFNAWQEAGLRVLAVWCSERGLRSPASVTHMPERGEAAIVAGPSGLMTTIIDRLEAAA